MRRLPFGTCFLILVFAQPAAAQSNEITLSGGMGSVVGDRNAPSPVVSFAYSRSITDRIAVEGSLERSFIHHDDFVGGQVAGVFHFRSAKETGRVIPFVTAGIGFTSTDPTEIPSHTVVRLGGGLKYYVRDFVGIRIEVRDEIIRADNDPYVTVGGSVVNYPSARLGVIFRF